VPNYKMLNNRQLIAAQQKTKVYIRTPKCRYKFLWHMLIKRNQPNESRN